jgi:hypothetical protein
MQRLETFDTTGPRCLKDLAAVGLTTAGVQALASSANLVEATSNLLNVMSAMHIDFEVDGNTIFYDPYVFWQSSFNQLLGTLLHEVIHTEGINDKTLAADLGVTLPLDANGNPLSTEGISQKLTADCFRGIKNP